MLTRSFYSIRRPEDGCPACKANGHQAPLPSDSSYVSYAEWSLQIRPQCSSLIEGVWSTKAAEFVDKQCVRRFCGACNIMIACAQWNDDGFWAYTFNCRRCMTYVADVNRDGHCLSCVLQTFANVPNPHYLYDTLSESSGWNKGPAETARLETFLRMVARGDSRVVLDRNGDFA